MRNKSKIDILLEKSSWQGSFARLGLMYGATLILYYFPTGAAWYSEYFLNRPRVVNQKGHDFEMGFLYFVVIVGTICEVINIIYMLRKNRKK